MTAYRDLIDAVDTLILRKSLQEDYGYSLEFESLDEEEKQMLTAYFIDYDDRDLVSIYDNSNRDEITASMLTMLKKCANESDEDFILCLKKNLAQYYANRAQELINERCEEIATNRNWDKGLVKRRYYDNGEIYLSRVRA